LIPLSTGEGEKDEKYKKTYGNRLLGCKLDLAGPGSYPVMGSTINCTELSGYMSSILTPIHAFE
jgi:hypothetical protein